MSVVGNFSRHLHLSETDEPLQTGSGWLTPAQRKAKLRENMGAGAGTNSVVMLTDVAAYTVLAENSGSEHLIPAITATITIDLPAVAAGLRYKFTYIGNATEAQNIVIESAGNTNYFSGGILWLDLNGGAAGDEVGVVYPDGNSNSELTIVTPAAGTWVEVYCDGTLWHIIGGRVVSDTTPAFADQ